MKLRILTALLTALVISGITFAQDGTGNVSKRGTTAAPFLNITQGARATGLGGAFVAIADDASSLYWNPSGISRIGQNSLMVDHTSWIAGINTDFVAASLELGSFGAVGVAFTLLDYGEMDVTTIEEPNGTGEVFGAQDAAFSLTWAVNLTENFSIGISPKVIYQSIWKMSDWALALDLGVLYNTPFPGITLGMSITNFGTKMQLQGTNSVVLYDPAIDNTGNNGRIPANLSTGKWDLPLNFRVGVSYRPFTMEDHDLVVAVDASHPNDNYEYINMGAEYTFIRTFSIRGGYKSMFLDDSEESFTIGVGIKQFLVGNIGISVDYSYLDFGRLKEVQKFSIGILF